MELTKEQEFEIKQKFLRTIPHPKLILKQILRLNKDFVADKKSDQNFQDLSVYLEGYENYLLKLKLEISNAPDQKVLSTSLEKLYELQQRLISKLSTYFPDTLEQKLDAVKMSEPFDTYEIVKLLKAESMNESEIKNYLCKELENTESDNLSVLTKSVLRAKKIKLNE